MTRRKVTTSKKPEECDTCGFATRRLVHTRAMSDYEGDLPYTLAEHWRCRLCHMVGFEVHQGRVSHSIVQMFNVLLEAVERRTE